MYINKEWRILTIGDGDLSFSASIFHNYSPKKLTGTIFDTKEILFGKYGDEFYRELNDCEVLTGFDVTDSSTWSTLTKHSYDLIIFQFPLIPGFKSLEEFQEKCSSTNKNTINRRLLRTFLLNSFDSFLDPDGAKLCYITSKDVKPYCEWNIEQSLIMDTPLKYLGSMAFDISKFPNYKIRHVDRDKHVKDTKGITYVWSDTSKLPFTHIKLDEASHIGDKFCTYCKVGEFSSKFDRIEHEKSKKHKRIMQFEELWLEDLKRNRKVNEK